MLQQNIAPSLRQSMINEALDYHQNMNSVVFKRQARNLETYARESGKTDPSPKDVLVEGTIRQKVGEISTQIQRLNQQLNYASSGAPAPAVGSGGRRGKVSKANRAARRSAVGTELVIPQQKDYNRRRDEEHARLDELEFTPLPTYDEEGEFVPNVGQTLSRQTKVGGPQSKETRKGTTVAPQSVLQLEDIRGVPVPEPDIPRNIIRPRGGPQYSFLPPQTSIVPMRSNLGLPSIQPYYYSSDPDSDPSDSDPESKYPEVEEGESKSQAGYEASVSEGPDFGWQGTPSGSVGSPSTATGIRSELERRGLNVHPSQVGFLDEPTAPGARFSSSPNASDSSRLNIIVDNSLAAIVGGYNTLIDYIDLQQKQRAFTQQDEQLVSQLLRELIEPLKMLIANSAVARQSANKSLVDYTRIYNVISTLINRITSSPPFLKVPSGILTEKLPIREDIIQAANYNPDKQANHEYLESLVKTIRQEFDLVIRTFPKSPIEKEARELKLKELQTAYAKVIKAGYRPSEEIAEDIQTYEASKEEHPQIEELIPHAEKRFTKTYFETADIETEKKEILEEYRQKLEHLDYLRGRVFQDEQLLSELIRDFQEGTELFLEANEAAHTVEDPEEIQGLVDAREELRVRQTKDINEINSIRDGLENLDRFIEETVSNLQSLNRELTGRKFSDQYKEAMQDLINEQYEDVVDLKDRSKRMLGVISAFEKKFPKSEVIKQTKTYHQGKLLEDKVEKDKRLAKIAEVKKKYKGEFPTFLGDGKHILPKASGDGKKTGGHVHKKSADPFGDNSELAPYLTKYLRPSKHRQEVPEIVSSSEESSDSENDQPVRKKVGLGKKKRVKAVEDFEIIISAPKADQGFLLEKKKPKRTGGKKKAKPVHEARPEQDLWFM